MDDWDDRTREVRLLEKIDRHLEELVDLWTSPITLNVSINGGEPVATTIVLIPGTPKEN